METTQVEKRLMVTLPQEEFETVLERAATQGRLAAIVDFTFNPRAERLQTSTLRRRINQRNWAVSANELRRWVYGGGKVLSGLVTRRTAEAAWLLRTD